MPLHLITTAAGDTAISGGTIYNPDEVFLAIGNLTTTPPWLSSIDAPEFDPLATGLENLLAMRRPDTQFYVNLNEGVKHSFTISNVTDPTKAARSFRLLSSSYEYCVWLDRSGTETDPTIAGQKSVRVIATRNSNILANIASAINDINEFSVASSPTIITITRKAAGVGRVIDVDTGFTFTQVDAGVDPGNIYYTSQHWSKSDTPTNKVFTQYHIDSVDIPTSTIYQFGLYLTPTINVLVDPGKMMLAPADFTSLGTFLGGVNSFPIARASNKQNIVNFIITLP